MSATTAVPPPPRFEGPLRLGGVELASRFNLAPLAGYTNLPFRLSVHEIGGLGLATTDLVNARAILEGSRKTFELLATCPEDRPLAVQIFGARPDEMAEAARRVVDLGATVVDVNMGCPVRKVVRSGGGSALMCEQAAAVAMVGRLVEAVRVPVTVKMRLGWDDDNHSAPQLARAFEDVGVAAVTIHGRTREQGFGGSVNHAGIRAVVEAVQRMPVIGNGDVRTVADAARMFDETGCAGIAIGRGALANPWLLRQLRDWVATGDPGSRAGWFDRLEFMTTHLRRLIEWRGEKYGCIQFRKVSTWYARSLRTGHEVQQRLVQLDTWSTFREIADRLRNQGPPPGWEAHDLAASVAVPAGPIAHW
jgi:nifR3 family TIM-barrel protein